MLRFIVARVLIGVSLLVAGSLTVPSASPMVAPPSAPVLIRVDGLALTTPVSLPDASYARANDMPPAAPAPTAAPATLTPREVFLQALGRSSWPLAQHARVEALVGGCENTTYEPAKTVQEKNGTTSVGYLQVNVESHPDLAARFDLTDPLGNLNAGKIVEDRARERGLPSPWVNCDAVIAARVGGGN